MGTDKSTCVETINKKLIKYDSLDLIIKHIQKLQQQWSFKKINNQNLLPSDKGKYYKTFSFQGDFKIDLETYLKRIQKFMEVDESVLIFASLLLEKSTIHQPELKNPDCIHKLQIACLTQAAKLVEDITWESRILAKIFGVDVKTLFELEAVMFFEVFKCRIIVSEIEFNDYLENQELLI